MQQDQFLDVIDRDEAERRFRAALDLRRLEAESVPLGEALGRVLAEDVIAPLDVPNFDRSNVDGFAVRAEDTFGASDEQPRLLHVNAESLVPGVVSRRPVAVNTATSVATGAVVPRGADAVVMIEYTDTDTGRLIVRRPVTPGANITFTGTDIGAGETVLRCGERLTSRETGVLAAPGLAHVAVVRRPRVGIISTGNELIPPGAAMRPGLVFDSNATILADAVRELGGEPVAFGIVADDRDALPRRCDTLWTAMLCCCPAARQRVKAICRIASSANWDRRASSHTASPSNRASRYASPPFLGGRTVPVVILPGFPTSAIFTFREFVAPVIRRFAGLAEESDAVVEARLPMRVNSERGRTEYLLVGLVSGDGSQLVAYPMGKGSGSVTTFSRADGFVVIPRQREYLETGDRVAVHLLSRDLQPADLVVIGSHCIGLDYLLGQLH